MVVKRYIVKASILTEDSKIFSNFELKTYCDLDAKEAEEKIKSLFKDGIEINEIYCVPKRIKGSS